MPGIELLPCCCVTPPGLEDCYELVEDATNAGCLTTYDLAVGFLSPPPISPFNCPGFPGCSQYQDVLDQTSFPAGTGSAEMRIAQIQASIVAWVTFAVSIPIFGDPPFLGEGGLYHTDQNITLSPNWGGISLIDVYWYLPGSVICSNIPPPEWHLTSALFPIPTIAGTTSVIVDLRLAWQGGVMANPTAAWTNDSGATICPVDTYTLDAPQFFPYLTGAAAIL